MTYPDLQQVSYAPNALGQATQVGTYATGISYYPNGAIHQFTYGNGVVHTMTQNTRLLPTRSRDAKGTLLVLDDTYAFDANGNVTDITDQAQGGLTTRGMGYDSRDRLTAAVAPGLWGNASYSYDGLDNLTQADQGARKYRYAYASNQHLSQINDPNGIPQFTFGYDAAGNVSLKNNQAYGFDSAHRLTQVTGLQSYRYDGLGRRVQTTDADGSTTFWQYSQAGQVLYASEARKHRNTAYIYLGNTQVAAWHIAWGGGPVTIDYEHTDALGSPVAQTDTTGAITSRESYAPYGEAFNAPIDGPGYTGHVMDAATGLTYMQQRYYDPQIGRFLSVDPAGGDNRYVYAFNSPYKFTDTDGRWPSVWFAPIHENSIDRVIGSEVSMRDLEILKWSQVLADSKPYQTAESSFRHAMRSPQQTPAQARAIANRFVRDQFQKAWNAPTRQEALTQFGLALHTLQDATSPAHAGFQEWKGIENETHGEEVKHVEKELYDPGAGSSLDRVTKAAWKAFESGKLPSGDLFQAPPPRMVDQAMSAAGPGGTTGSLHFDP